MSTYQFHVICPCLYQYFVDHQCCLLFPLSANISVNFTEFLLNCSKCQFIIWWAGLMRGAVTIALSYNQASTWFNFVPCWKFCLNQTFDLRCFQVQFSKSEIASAENSALMITSTIILVLFSTVVGFHVDVHNKNCIRIT